MMSIELFSGMKDESQMIYNLFPGLLSYKCMARYKGVFSSQEEGLFREDLINLSKILTHFMLQLPEHGIPVPHQE